MYLGFVVALLGLAVCLGSLVSFAGPLGFGLLANAWCIPFEEQAMLRAFGE